MPQARYKGNSRQEWYIDAISAAKCFSTLPRFTFRFGVSSPSAMLKGFSMTLKERIYVVLPAQRIGTAKSIRIAAVKLLCAEKIGQQRAQKTGAARQQDVVCHGVAP